MKKIAYQGKPGAYSHLVCIKAYPDYEPISCDSFEEVFEKTELRETNISLIPIENSQAGRVADIHNLLPMSKLVITGEYFHKVRHHLLGCKGSSLESIKTAESHLHALAQCKEFLKNNKIKALVSADTAGAAEDISVAKDFSRAAIASELAAKIYKLEILSSNIEDAINNTTRFLIMKKKFEEDRISNVDYITSFIFQVRNIPSALFKALGGFSSNKINMLKLESYMLKGSFKATQFYADIQGHPEDENVKQAFEELGFFSKEVKVLGFYPASKLRE
ncbi:MAG: prephenate dehydratase [Rickettsiales bacterium]|nr:prephenate dehydratase [Rickettsiales bacterium]